MAAITNRRACPPAKPDTTMQTSPRKAASALVGNGTDAKPVDAKHAFEPVTKSTTPPTWPLMMVVNVSLCLSIYKQRFGDGYLSDASTARSIAKGLLSNQMEVPITYDFTLALAAYAGGKLLLRRMVGSEADPRGWGLETYISAFCHQWLTVILGICIISMHSASATWLGSPWGSSESQRPERFFILCQWVEMLTDITLHSHYPAFGAAYLWHHASTFLATSACLWWTHIPVGGVVAIITLLEFGGLALNYVSLWTPLFGSSTPKVLYETRLIVFVGSRMAATVVMAKTTAIGLTMEHKPWAAIIFAWCILAVNYRWVAALVRRKLKGSDVMSGFT